jgi:hypothetical protein
MIHTLDVSAGRAVLMRLCQFLPLAAFQALNFRNRLSLASTDYEVGRIGLIIISYRDA